MVPGPKDNASALEELRQKLYANNPSGAEPAPSVPAPHAPVAHIETTRWQEPPRPPKKKIARSVWFLIAGAVVFVIAIATAAYFLLFGAGAISTDHVSIVVAPLPSLRSGDVATLLLTVRNDNPTPMTHTRLSVVFPESARSADDPLLPFPRYEDTLGDIPAGGTLTRSIRVVLSGAEGEVVTLPIKLEYATANSNAVFVKEDTHEVTITSSPLSLQVEVPTQATAGQQITLRVTIHSDATVPIENLAVFAEYPFGFLPEKTGESTNVFEVGTLAPGKEATLLVRGTLTGEDAEERIFRFKVGTRGNAGALGITYASGSGSIGLSRPFLATTFSVNTAHSTTIVIPSGETAAGSLQWVNTLPSDLTDVQIAVKFSGNAFDASSVNTVGGFYRSVDSTIIYGRDTVPGLARLAPGASGNASFNFSTKPKEALLSLRNPTINAVITVSGRTSKDGNAPTLLTAVQNQTIQIATDFGTTARATRTTGPFKNTGPVPPQPNVETTYTVLLNLTSSVNTVAGATVRGVLPPYVRFMGVTSPDDGSITYDQNSRTVTWAAGDVVAGTTATSPKQGAFQVALLPSVSQRGTSPVLMSSITYTGTDRFTKRVLEGRSPDVSTQTLGDAGYQGVQGEVTR